MELEGGAEHQLTQAGSSVPLEAPYSLRMTSHRDQGPGINTTVVVTNSPGWIKPHFLKQLGLSEPLLAAPVIFKPALC